MIIDVKLDIFLLDITKENITKDTINLELNNETGIPYTKGFLELKNKRISERLSDNTERVFIKINGIESAYVIENIDYDKDKTTVYFIPSIANVLKEKKIFDDMSLFTFHAFLASIGVSTANVIDFILPSDNKTKSVLDRLNEFCKVCGAEYYYDNGLIVTQPKVQKSTATKIMRSENIVKLTRQEAKQDVVYDGVGINISGETTLTTKPTITLSIDPSPQPFSPDSTVVYIDGDNEYRIIPIRATVKLYFSPYIGGQTPAITSPVPLEFRLQRVIEKYELKNELIFFTASNIQSVIDVELDGVDVDYTFEQGYNAIKLNQVANGTIKIAYTSYIYIGKIPPSREKKELRFLASLLDQELDYTHTYKAEGYFPLGYVWEVDFVSDLDIDPDDAVNIMYTIGLTSFYADSFGYAEITFLDYGVYKLTYLTEERWIVYYANRFSIESSEPKAT